MRHKLSHILLLTGLCALAWSSTARALSLEIVPASHFVAVGTSTSVDLVIAGLIVLAIVAIGVRFVIRRRREAAGKNPESAVE